MTLHHLRALGVALLLAGTSSAAQDPADRELAAYLRAITDRSGAGLQQTTHADGTVTLELGRGFQHAYIAEQTEDGLRGTCVGSVAEANRFFGRNLDSGKRLPAYSAAAPRQLQSQAALHGMSAEQYAFYWSLIEQAQAQSQSQAQSQPVAPLAATISIINNDGAGEGFNDPTSVAPEGGNPGTTRGAQRLNVFNQAASIWGAFLDSGVTTQVRANFDPLTPCSPSGAVLGAAGAVSLHRDFPNAPFSNTFYPAALANKLRGSDLSANPEIETVFNSNIDNGCLGAGSRFYYGFDNATPANRINLLVVVLHELGHGLGSASYTNELNGVFPGTPAAPDIWARFQFDRSFNLTWLQMSNAQRQASAINANNLLWDGPSVRIASGFLTLGRDALGRVELYTPNPIELGSSVSHWNDRVSPNLLMEPSINTGLPLTLDLTRQQMRDIGWYRDATANLVPDTITNVQPNSGIVDIGSTINITWTNTGSFNRNVTIELSLNGGSTYPTVIASDVANTGSRSWTVPNTPSSQARIRVREHDFAAPLGSSSGNFTIGTSNTPPVFTPAAPISRQRGSPAGAAATLGTVSDAQTPAGSLSVTQIGGGSATGISVGNLSNTNGTISATLAASCSANSGTLRFQVSDGSLTSTGDLQVNVSANTPPTLSYSNQSIDVGAGISIDPATGPSDNGSINGILVQSTGTYSGGIAVHPSSGVITISNAAPIGNHSITIRAIDNCSAVRDASFTLSVTNTAPTFVPVAPINRQQGSPGGAAVLIGQVSDAQTPAGDLAVSLINGGTAGGISVSGLNNVNGSVSAVLSANCSASSGTLRFQVFDGNLASTADLQVNVSANTPPQLGQYPASMVAPGQSLNVPPSAPPSDNGSIVSLEASANPASFSGSLSAALPTGVVAIGNAGPEGSYQITLTATDQCGASAHTQFGLSVGTGNGDGVFSDGFE